MFRSPPPGMRSRAVIESNQRLFDQLDVERFFFSVRPYYKPYMVGRQEYRGANAGDFSGINEIDLLLGLCRANDPYYAQLLVDKMQFMPPQDQAGCANACGTRVFSMSCWRWRRARARGLVSAQRAGVPRSLRVCLDDMPASTTTIW